MAGKKPKALQRVREQKVKDPSKLKVSAKVKEAIHQMIYNGLNRAKAAESAGLKDHSLYVALCKPHVMQYKNRVLREFRESLAEKSLIRMDGLADNADKDSVKFQSNKFLIEQDQRFTPTTKQIHEGRIEHRVTPGYIIDLSEPEDLLNTHQVIDVEDIS